MRLTLNMIVGPIDETWLLPALDNVAAVVDWAVINDNGALPANRERIMGSRFAREGRLTLLSTPFENFAQARNVCLEATPPTEWILRLDADEVHFPDRVDRLVAQLPEWQAGGVRTVRVPFYHLLSHKIYQSFEDCAQFFCWHPSMRWSGVVHETLNAHGAIVTSSEHFVHYSYCHPQPVVFQKWEHYSVLDGDPDHYRVRGTQPDTVIADRYAMAGAPFLLPHPPGAAEYWAGEVAAGRQRDLPFQTVVVLYGERAEKFAVSLGLLQQNLLADYPVRFVLAAPAGAAQALDERHGHEAQVMEIPAGELWEQEAWLRADWGRRAREDAEPWGNVLFLAAGAFFTSPGWQKALVNGIYCLPHYRGYRPQTGRHTLLVPRDVLAASDAFPQPLYFNPYVLVSEEHL